MKKTEPWEWALGGGVTVLAWYALPDVVRSKKLRSLIKAGLLGVTAYAGTMLPGLATEVEDLSTSVRKQLVDLPPKTATGILVGGTAAMAAITVLAEKWIFTRGELRRARGVGRRTRGRRWPLRRRRRRWLPRTASPVGRTRPDRATFRESEITAWEMFAQR